MNLYATLQDLRLYLGLSSAQTGDDGLLLSLLGAASRLVEGSTGRHFYPVQKTVAHTCHHPAILMLRGDLISLDQITNGDGTTIPLSAAHVQPSSIVLDRTQAAFTHMGDPVDALSIEGLWGCHPDWANAWAESGDTVHDNPLSASAIALTVGDVEGPDSTGTRVRFAVGQLLRIEDEYLHVLAINPLTDVLTVRRGANGTTATIHASGTVIEVYQPPEDVRQACLRVAAWLYKQKDAGFVQSAGGLRGQIAVPPALPDDVQQILAPYIRVRVA